MVAFMGNTKVNRVRSSYLQSGQSTAAHEVAMATEISRTLHEGTMKGKKTFTCDRCDYKSTRSSNLTRHIFSIHENSPRNARIYTCSEGGGCKYQTSRKDRLIRHISARHRQKKLRNCKFCEFSTTSLSYFIKHEKSHASDAIKNHSCSVCKISFDSETDFEKHLDESHPKDENFKLINHAFQKNLRVYQNNIRKKGGDISCLWEIFPQFKGLCKRILAKDFPNYRLNVVMFGVFTKLSPDELEEAEVLALKTSPFIIKPHTKLKNVWTTIIRNLDDRLENLLMHGSGWSLTEVSCVITD